MTEQAFLLRARRAPPEIVIEALVDYFRSIGWHDTAREVEDLIEVGE